MTSALQTPTNLFQLQIETMTLAVVIVKDYAITDFTQTLIGLPWVTSHDRKE